MFPGRYVFLTIPLFLLCSRPSECLVDDVIDILKLSKDVGQSLFENLGVFADLAGQDFQMPREKKILNKFAELDRKISRLEVLTQITTSSALFQILSSVPQRQRLHTRLDELVVLVNKIRSAEATMLSYREHQDTLERHTLEDFASRCVAHDPDSVPGMLERIHQIVSPEQSNIGLPDQGIMDMMTSAFKESNEQLCSLQQSAHQLLYNMYNTITVTEIKGYAMMQFSYMLLRLYGKGNFTKEAQLARDKFQQRSTRTLHSVMAALEEASREIWRCDPSYHEEGETFVSLTRLLQGYVENEVDMNKDGTCRENCAYYTYTKNYGCFKDQYCSRQPACKGKILDCKYVDSDMWICPAERGSGRRYEWIEYENGRVLGEKGYCKRGATKVDSWWRWLFWHCSYCTCLCDQPDSFSDRHFSLFNVVSDVIANKIVTGIRFVKVNRVIHLQISEATLLPRGKVDPSVRWKPVEPLDIKDSNQVEGVDYHTMSFEQRAIDLDDLHADDEHLLTGVRLRKVGSHLNLEIRITPFDFVTGKLIDPSQKSLWISNDNTDVAAGTPRTEVLLVQPNVPTRSRTPSIPSSLPDQYIQFTHSDFDADAAQSTVPFLDAQPVAPTYPVPLSGAGLYHKGRKFYGGFVAPKVFTYDFSKHMSPVFPQEPQNE